VVTVDKHLVNKVVMVNNNNQVMGNLLPQLLVDMVVNSNNDHNKAMVVPVHLEDILDHKLVPLNHS